MIIIISTLCYYSILILLLNKLILVNNLVFVYSVLLKIIVDVFSKYSVVVIQCDLVKNDFELLSYCELMNELFYTYPK